MKTSTKSESEKNLAEVTKGIINFHTLKLAIWRRSLFLLKQEIAEVVSSKGPYLQSPADGKLVLDFNWRYMKSFRGYTFDREPDIPKRCRVMYRNKHEVLVLHLKSLEEILLYEEQHVRTAAAEILAADPGCKSL